VGWNQMLISGNRIGLLFQSQFGVFFFLLFSYLHTVSSELMINIFKCSTEV